MLSLFLGILPTFIRAIAYITYHTHATIYKGHCFDALGQLLIIARPWPQ
jgi:hypothetical protein